MNPNAHFLNLSLAKVDWTKLSSTLFLRSNEMYFFSF
jgi:hypothetical protein